MKKFFIFLLTIIVILINSNNAAYAKQSAPSVVADSAVLIDATTGTVLYSKNMNTAYPPASTTKIMTTLLTLENANLNDMAKVSKDVPYVDGSKIGIAEGEEISVKNLLYGLLLMSGNDCAEALAEHVGGSIQNFAGLMTKRAKELGCESTNFVNPSGLYNENHKISAKDLALIMREVMKHPEFREIASTFSYKIPPTNKHPQGIYLANENKLINKNSKYYYQYAEAGKTGYTVQSKHSYVASATKNSQRLIVALVHDSVKNFYTDSKNLFEYGFNNYELKELYKEGDSVTTFSQDSLKIPLTAAEDYYYVKEKNSTALPQFEVISSDLINKDFKKGDQIMEASVTLKNKSLPNLKLSSGIDYSTKTELTASSIYNKPQSKYRIYSIVGICTLSLGFASALFIKFKLKKN